MLILKVFMRPPVPQVSIKNPSIFGVILIAYFFIVCISTKSSCAVSPFIRSATRNEAIAARILCPARLNLLHKLFHHHSVKPFVETNFWIIRLRSSIRTSFFQHGDEVLEYLLTIRRQNWLRVKLNAFYQVSFMLHAHYFTIIKRLSFTSRHCGIFLGSATSEWYRVALNGLLIFANNLLELYPIGLVFPCLTFFAFITLLERINYSFMPQTNA